MTDVLRPVRVEVVSGTDADLVADRLRALDAAAPSPGLVTVCVVGAAGVAPLVLAAPGSPLAGSDVMLNWGHGVTRDALVDRLWGERIEPLARRLAGLTGPSPAPARLVEHDQRWGVVAHGQLSRLARALGEAGVDRGGSGGSGGFGYEHIGSTAVPGLLAKAFVDLQLGVDEIPAAGGAFDEALLRCGYLPAVGSRPDSPGVDRDLEMFPGACAEGDYRKRLYYRPDPGMPSILHVRRAGTPWHDYPIRFRDLLRESTQHRERYAAVKTAAAQAHADDADHDDCTRAKGEVIRDVLVAAGCEPGRLEALAPLPVARPETATPRRTRHTARVLPVDPSGRVLLLHGVDPDDREHPLWFSLGGEIDPGEDPVTAALRELREEVGLLAGPGDVEVLGEQAIQFSWGSVTFDQRQVICAVRVRSTDVDLSGQDAVEQATIDEARWWAPEDLAATTDLVGEGLLAWVRRAAAR